MKPTNHSTDGHESDHYSQFERELVKASDDLTLTPLQDSWQRLEMMIDTTNLQASKPNITLLRWFSYAAAASVLLAVSIWGLNKLSGPPQLITENIVAEATPYFTSYLATSHELAGYTPVLEGDKIHKLTPPSVQANPISGDTILDM